MNNTHTPHYELVSGLEVHAELKTNSKMFCGCQNDPFAAPEPNCYTCPVCLGMPGALPVANKTAIESVLKLGLALGCKINLFSKFDRKHYFYPDLPKGYQISQYDLPFCYDGQIETSFGPIRIRRIHLEEDTGKLLHTTVNGEKVSLIDFNRGGVPLVEIVTEADITSPAQAKEYGKKLRHLLRYLGIADCDMEQGGMRLEANISVRPTGETELPNYKVEVKNINSFRFLEQAISFEVQRQTIELMDGRTPKQETRGWNSEHNTTFPQRSKEDAEDYRYFPDPDLPPLRFTEEYVEGLRQSLPELPDAVIEAWQAKAGIETRYSEQLLDSIETKTKIDGLISACQNQALEPNKVISALVNRKLGQVTLDDSVEQILAAYKATAQTETLSESELDTLIKGVLAANPNEVARYQKGEEQLLNFFVGQSMRALGKKVDSQLIKTALIAALQA